MRLKNWLQPDNQYEKELDELEAHCDLVNEAALYLNFDTTLETLELSDYSLNHSETQGERISTNHCTKLPDKDSTGLRETWSAYCNYVSTVAPMQSLSDSLSSTPSSTQSSFSGSSSGSDDYWNSNSQRIAVYNWIPIETRYNLRAYKNPIMDELSSNRKFSISFYDTVGLLSDPDIPPPSFMQPKSPEGAIKKTPSLRSPKRSLRRGRSSGIYSRYSSSSTVHPQSGTSSAAQHPYTGYVLSSMAIQNSRRRGYLSPLEGVPVADPQSLEGFLEEYQTETTFFDDAGYFGGITFDYDETTPDNDSLRRLGSLPWGSNTSSHVHQETSTLGRNSLMGQKLRSSFAGRSLKSILGRRRSLDKLCLDNAMNSEKNDSSESFGNMNSSLLDVQQSRTSSFCSRGNYPFPSWSLGQSRTRMSQQNPKYRTFASDRERLFGSRDITSTGTPSFANSNSQRYLKRQRLPIPAPLLEEMVTENLNEQHDDAGQLNESRLDSEKKQTDTFWGEHEQRAEQQDNNNNTKKSMDCSGSPTKSQTTGSSILSLEFPNTASTSPSSVWLSTPTSWSRGSHTTRQSSPISRLLNPKDIPCRIPAPISCKAPPRRESKRGQPS